MKPPSRGLVVAALQCALVLSVVGKYTWDRQRLPRVWARVAPYDPSLPIRGRYLRLRLEVDVPFEPPTGWLTANLAISGGRLMATPAARETGVRISRFMGRSWTIVEPLAFFIPENVPDPAVRAPGEELWVEVSVPPKGVPRPLRLGIRKNGALTPLAFR